MAILEFFENKLMKEINNLKTYLTLTNLQYCEKLGYLF